MSRRNVLTKFPDDLASCRNCRDLVVIRYASAKARDEYRGTVHDPGPIDRNDIRVEFLRAFGREPWQGMRKTGGGYHVRCKPFSLVPTPGVRVTGTTGFMLEAEGSR